jgi:hypothetical protein
MFTNQQQHVPSFGGRTDTYRFQKKPSLTGVFNVPKTTLRVPLYKQTYRHVPILKTRTDTYLFLGRRTETYLFSNLKQIPESS